MIKKLTINPYLVLFFVLSLRISVVHADAPSPFIERELALVNQTDVALPDHQIILTKRQLQDFPKDHSLEGISLLDAEKQNTLIASQAIDQNLDGKLDALVFNLDIPASGKRIVRLVASPNTVLAPYAPTKRAQFDMGFLTNGTLNEKGWYEGGTYRQVTAMHAPPGHTRGNRLFRYEGFGWESDKVGYRYYFDHRATIDIFGKRLPAMVLHEVGFPGNDYHSPDEWGFDILKVGDSLGLGSIGYYDDDRTQKLDSAENLRVKMLDDGPLMARFKVQHDNWKVADKNTDISTEYAIAAGSRLTKASVSTKRNLSNVTTGIVKAGLTPIISNDPDSAWGYLATYGLQSLAKDGLGMVIFFPTKQVLKLTDDAHSHLVVLKPEKKTLNYYFGAAWVQEFQGVSDEVAFRQYLEDTRKILNQPVDIQLR